jgi:hypothetical protein
LTVAIIEKFQKQLSEKSISDVILSKAKDLYFLLCVYDLALPKRWARK